jgi:hypothetical protein
MTHLARIVCVVLMITGSLFLDSALGKEAVVPQKTFTTAEEAAEVLGVAYKRGDNTAVARILGDKGLRLVSSGDPVIDRHEREWFLSLFREGHAVVFESEDRAVLQIGKDECPYPIPLVKKCKRWRFAPTEGHEDLISRRIGKAELSALNVMVAYVDAQGEYYRKDRNGDGVLEYAQRFRSSPGQHDGLYWQGKPGEASSPIAAIADAIQEEGYEPAEEGCTCSRRRTRVCGGWQNERRLCTGGLSGTIWDIRGADLCREPGGSGLPEGSWPNNRQTWKRHDSFQP